MATTGGAVVGASVRLTPWRATALMVGAGVGAGIMAVPALAARTGIGWFAILLPATWALSCLVHLLIAEVSLRTPGDLQLIELMRLYVLRGRRLAWLVWLAFGLLVVAFVAALAAYVAAAAEIVTTLTSAPAPLAQLAVYLGSALVVLFGLGAVGALERFGAAALVACVVVLVAGAMAEGLALPPSPPAGGTDLLGLYGLVMYGYATYFGVPQVVQGLRHRPHAAVGAIVGGLAVNGLLMAGITVVALGSGDVTEMAMTGIAEALGPWAATTGSLFVLVALLTTYWSVSLALTDILVQRVRMGRTTAWLVATLPSLLLLYAGVLGFLGWMSLAAGTTALVVALITVPMVVNARRHGSLEPGWSLGRLGGGPMLAVAFVATVLMALGAIQAM